MKLMVEHSRAPWRKETGSSKRLKSSQGHHQFDRELEMISPSAGDLTELFSRPTLNPKSEDDKKMGTFGAEFRLAVTSDWSGQLI